MPVGLFDAGLKVEAVSHGAPSRFGLVLPHSLPAPPAKANLPLRPLFALSIASSAASTMVPVSFSSWGGGLPGLLWRPHANR